MPEKMTSPCCNAPIRAHIDQECEIHVSASGIIESCADYTDPQIDRSSAFCAECDKSVDIYGTSKIDSITKCPKCNSTITDVGEVLVCDNESCGWNEEHGVNRVFKS